MIILLTPLYMLFNIPKNLQIQVYHIPWPSNPSESPSLELSVITFGRIGEYQVRFVITFQRKSKDKQRLSIIKIYQTIQGTVPLKSHKTRNIVKQNINYVWLLQFKPLYPVLLFSDTFWENIKTHGTGVNSLADKL